MSPVQSLYGVSNPRHSYRTPPNRPISSKLHRSSIKSLSHSDAKQKYTHIWTVASCFQFVRNTAVDVAGSVQFGHAWTDVSTQLSKAVAPYAGYFIPESFGRTQRQIKGKFGAFVVFTRFRERQKLHNRESETKVCPRVG